MILWWILFILTFSLGYYLGGKGRIIAEETKEQITKLMKDKPQPGVVNSLTPQQIEEKHDPIKKGNLESFNRLFREHPIK